MSKDLLDYVKLVQQKIDKLDDDRDIHNRVYGDDRGAHYQGSMEGDLRRLVQLVWLESA